MQFPAKLFIDGKYCDASGGKTLPVINPATEETLVEVAAAAERDVETAISGAHRTYEQSWRDCTPGRRAEILFQIARVLREHAEE